MEKGQGLSETLEVAGQEIAKLFEAADRDLSDCQLKGLSADWRLSIAYNAALQEAAVALAACGYRAVGEGHHYYVIQSLSVTIGADSLLVAQLDKFRKKRNISQYEKAGAVSDMEAEEAIALAKQLRKRVEKWLKDNLTLSPQGRGS